MSKTVFRLWWLSFVVEVLGNPLVRSYRLLQNHPKYQHW
jgi:hypothetical protein